MIYRTIKNRTKKIMLNLYKSLVRPQLDYCINVWRPHLKSDIKILENVQKRFTKSIQGLKKIKYKERLQILKLTSFETRCLRSDLLTCFKVFNNYESIDTKNLFVFNERKSRGNSFKLSKVYCRLDSSKFSFPHRVVDEWNKLKDDTVCSESINAFKGGLDRHLRAMGGLI
jgi:ribonuclease P/MRP protein subunit RPP40